MYILTTKNSRQMLLALLTLLLALMTLQVGPLALSAAAIPPEGRRHCPELGAIDRETLQDGAVIEWICKEYWIGTTDYWGWEFYRYVPGTSKKAGGTRTSSSPPYIMRVTSAVGDGVGGGDALGAIWIFQPDGTALNRRLQVHTIMEYSPTSGGPYSNCHDLGWVEAPTEWSFWHTTIKQYNEPDCGTGYYRAQVAGRFWAISTGAWESSSWHYSPAVFISMPCCAPPKEPTVTPTPPVTGNP